MAYVFLIEMHKFLGQRLEEANKALDEAGPDLEVKRFQEGRIQLLLDFQDFLSRNYNQKLPRKIRNRFKKINGTYTIIEKS